MLLMPDITSLKRTQALHGTTLSLTAGLITGSALLACKGRSALIIFITAAILTHTINNMNSLDKQSVYSILLYFFFSATQNVLNIVFVKMQNCSKLRLNSQHFCHGVYTVYVGGACESNIRGHARSDIICLCKGGESERKQ